MSIITRTLKEKRVHPGAPTQWLVDYFGGRESRSGVTVTEESALYCTAVYSCIRLLSSTLASLPLFPYKRMERGKERSYAHPTYKILHDEANPEMTSYMFRETLMAHILIYGNGYAQIVKDESGYPSQLWPLRPDRMTIKRENNQLVYKYNLPNAGEKLFNRSKILHIPGLGFDGIQGYSSIKLLNEAIGLSLATEQFGAMFFGEGTHPSATVTLPPDKNLGKDPDPTFLKSLKSGFAGLGKSHSLMLLEEGMKLDTIGVDPEKAQALQTRKYQVNEIARFYGIQPHMIGDLERSTNNNIEEQGLEFVIYTLRPWLVRWEQCLKQQLLSENEKKKYFYEFLIDGLLRGNQQARSEFYQKGVNNGWFSPNDILEMENKNPVKGGDQHFIPLNLIPLDMAGESLKQEENLNEKDEKSSEIEEKSQKDIETRAKMAVLARRRLKKAYKPMFFDAATRIINREKNDIIRESKKLLNRSQADFDAYLDKYYEKYGNFIEKNMLPVLISYAEAVTGAIADETGVELTMNAELEKFVRDYMAVYVQEHTISSREQLKSVVRKAIEEGKDENSAVEERLTQWEEKRPEKISSWQASESEGAVAKYSYKLIGIKRIRWNSIGKSCPYCEELSGQVIGIDKVFIRKTTGIQPGHEHLIFKPATNITHPPLHSGCDCYITGGG